jgi:hypothetical protein
MYLARPDPRYLELDTRYEAGFLEASQLRQYAGHADYDLSEAFLRRALGAKDECFAIREGDTLVSYGWYSLGANHFSDELTLHHDPGWVYAYRGFTHPAYRGRRLHANRMTTALVAYRNRGFKGLVTCVERSNSASLRSCARMGYRTFGGIYAVQVGRLLGVRRPRGRLLSLPLVYCTRGCRQFGLRLERTRRPPRSRVDWRPGRSRQQAGTPGG